MRMARLPAIETQPSTNEIDSGGNGSSGVNGRRVRAPAKDWTEAHSGAEEYLAYGTFVFVLASIVLGAIGLAKIAWKVQHGTYNSFGVIEVHLDAETHRLETMGLVWSVYTASRCSLGFTILGILISAQSLGKIYDFCAHSQRSIRYVMVRSLLGAFFYLFAIMLYGSLFPTQPFHGDLAYLDPNAFNSTSSLNSTQTSSGTSIGGGSGSGSGSGTGGVPVFPSPVVSNSSTTIGGTTIQLPTIDDPTAIDQEDDAESLATKHFYARLLWQHLSTDWRFGTGYWLVMSAALASLWWPFVYGAYLLGAHLYAEHKSREIQQRWLVGPIVFFACAWLLGVIGLATTHWKFDPDTGDHYGLDQLVIGRTQKGDKGTKKRDNS